MTTQHFYVYYRVVDPGSAMTRDCALGVIAEVGLRTGVSGRLLRRHDDAGTWMEIYEGVEQPDVFERALDAAVAAREFDAHLAAGSRRVLERFEMF